ncbi:hypothetical protein J6590_080495 [Homalodisca vitripennis]|nr:hypothetical protein J6590_080495 [Homalodisca vitripennis]
MLTHPSPLPLERHSPDDSFRQDAFAESADVPKLRSLGLSRSESESLKGFALSSEPRTWMATDYCRSDSAAEQVHTAYKKERSEVSLRTLDTSL